MDLLSSLIPIATTVGGAFLGGPAGAAAGATLGSALGGAYAADEANKTNVAITDKQMDFQKYMSNTAHRREVDDLRAAGLNPILSANSGASTPAGAAATVNPVTSDLSNVISSALNVANMKKELALKDSQDDLLKAQKIAADATTISNLSSARETDARRALTEFNLGRQTSIFNSELNAGVYDKKAQADAAASEADKLRSDFIKRNPKLDYWLNKLPGVSGSAHSGAQTFKLLMP